MSRSTAGWVASAALILSVSYVAFAWRAFYLRPTLSYAAEVPADARQSLEVFFEALGGVPVRPFRWPAAGQALVTPLKSGVPSVTCLRLFPEAAFFSVLRDGDCWSVTLRGGSWSVTKASVPVEQGW